MKISIKNFIKTAKFGPIEIGISKEKAIQVLGKPDSDNNLGETGSILLYGWYELFFNHENTLHSIQNDKYNPNASETYEFKNEVFKIDSWFLNHRKNQTIDEISKLLYSSDIDHSVINYYGRNVIITSSNVVIDFSDDENELGVRELIGIRYWPNEVYT